MANGRGHSGHAYRTLWRTVMNARPLMCWLCTREINPHLRYPDPWSKALHCIVPVSLGGPLNEENCVPTHRNCNLRQSNKLFHEGPFAGTRWVDGDP